MPLQVQEISALFPEVFLCGLCCESLQLLFLQLSVFPYCESCSSGLHLFNQFDFSSITKYPGIVYWDTYYIFVFETVILCIHPRKSWEILEYFYFYIFIISRLYLFGSLFFRFNLLFFEYWDISVNW